MKKVKLPNKNILLLSFNLGFMFMGIAMTFIATYGPICGLEENDIRIVIGTIFIAIGYVTFPFLERDTKDKFLLSFAIHIIIFAIIVLILYCEILYLMNNLNYGKWYTDLLFCIGGLFIFSYIIYIFIISLKVFSRLVQKVRIIIFPKIQDDVKGIKYVIELITAGILTITSFVGSISGLISLLKKLLIMIT